MEIYSKTSIKCEDKLTKNKTLKDKHFHKLPQNEIYLFQIHRTHLVIVFHKHTWTRIFIWIVLKDTWKSGTAFIVVQLYTIHHPVSTRNVNTLCWENATTNQRYKKLLIIWYLILIFSDRHLVYSHCFIIILPFSELGRLFECMFL